MVILSTSIAQQATKTVNINEVRIGEISGSLLKLMRKKLARLSVGTS